ncbi:uncharacterized protein LOC134088254 isoform X2 [Sardina pilchardus]|uniref:uncharacterized protein LOC134088254 isoform X2 n=1 Tax=Sardina pilchardus TaxID=27697 RepID=UPI002E0E1FB3
MALHQLVLFFLFLHCGLSDYWSSIRMLSVQNGQPAIIPCLYEKEHKDDTKLWCRKDDLSKCAPAVNSTQSQRPAGVSISDDITHGIFTVNMTNISRTDSGYHCCTVKPRTEPPITKDCTNIKVQDHPVLIVDNAMISGNESGTASFSFQYRYSGTSQMFCQLRGECVVSSATDPGSLNGMSVMLSNVARRVTLNGLQRKNTGWYVLSIWPYQIPVHLNVIGIEPTPGSPETNTNTTASNPDHHGMVEVLVPVCIAVLIVLCAVVGLVRWRRGKRKPPQQAAADANSACETIRLDETRRKVSPKHVVSADAVYVNDMRWERSPKQALKVSAARNLYTEVRV